MSTLATLERRLAAVEQLVAKPPDQLTPNYLTVNPDGTIGAHFTGVINAKGLIIPTALTSTVGPENMASWQRPDNNAQTAYVGGYDDGSASQLYVASQAQGSDTSAAVLVEAITGALRAQLSPQTSTIGDAGVSASCTDGTNSAGATIITQRGQSSFFQTWAERKIMLDAGGGVVTYNGGTNASRPTLITPNFPSNPTGGGMVATCLDSNAYMSATGQYDAFGNLQFNVYGVDPQAIQPIGAQMNFYWIAFATY